MNELVTTLLEAVRLSRAELDAHGSMGRQANAAVTLARLRRILQSPDVTEASELLAGLVHSPSLVPEPAQ